MRFSELERNDLEGALQYWRERRELQSTDDMRFEMLPMLFDDPTEFLAAMRAELDETASP